MTDRHIDRHLNRMGARHVTIKVDSANWKAFVAGGALACALALVPTVDVFDEATIRGMVFVGGLCVLVGGLRLRHHFKSFIGRQVQSIIKRHC